MPLLSDFYTNWNNNNFDPNGSQAQDFLSRLKQYDPNANLEIQRDETGRDIGNFNFNRNSLPLNPTGSRGFNGYQPMYSGEKYQNPDLKWDDPVYGKGTDQRNFIPEANQGFKGLGRYMPMATMAILGAMGGAAFGPMLGGGLAGSTAWGAGKQGLSMLMARQQQQAAMNRQRGFQNDINTNYGGRMNLSNMNPSYLAYLRRLGRI